jgi:hypothetical protein
LTLAAAVVVSVFWPGRLHRTGEATSALRYPPEPTGTAAGFGAGRARHLIAISFAHADRRTRRCLRSATRPAFQPAHRPMPAAARTVAGPLSPPPPAPTAGPPAISGCGAAIAAVEAKGLHPAPGFTVLCPGYAQGREGMTCANIPGICPGQWVIAIADETPFVVANEFENSRIVLGLPTLCDAIDCGGAAYGF